jgi:predicted transposase YdaD
MADHDKAFKELLITFFPEFVDLFLPDVSQYLDKPSIVFLDKELFTDSSRYEADVVVRARFKHEDSFFLIHTEAQAQHQANFPRRLFDYFSRLHARYDLPVYPIALLSFDSPKTVQPSEYVVSFPDREVLRFNYTVIQLNRLSWQPYINQLNPVAAALVPTMKIALQDRPRVKLKCEQLAFLLNLDWAKLRIISGFIETYLALTSEEQKKYEKERSKLPKPQQEAIMAFEPIWKQEGIQQGRREGRQEGRREGMVELVRKLLTLRLGVVDPLTLDRVQKLATEQIEALSAALFDFKTAADLEQWLQLQEQ